MPQQEPVNKRAGQKSCVFLSLIPIALVGCEAIDSEPLPSAPSEITQPAPLPPSISAPAQEIVVTDANAIPEAPAVSTDTYDTGYGAYWQQSQNADRKPLAPAPVQYEPTPVYGEAKADTSFPAETYSVVEQPAPEAPYAPASGSRYIASSGQAYPVQDTYPATAASIQANSTSSTGELYGLHLASYRIENNAVKGWSVLRNRYQTYLSPLEPRLRLVDIPGKGTYYRLIAGPYSTSVEAAAACESIKLTGDYCAVTRFSGASLGG